MKLFRDNVLNIIFMKTYLMICVVSSEALRMGMKR